MNDKKLIVIRGNSGSGKTSLAKMLQKKIGRNTLLISQDVVRREMLWVKDGQDTPVLPFLMDLLRYGYEHCEVTILEGILDANRYRPLFKTALALFGKNIFAFYFDIPFEETLKRHETKNCHLEFGEEEMCRWWKEKDYIGFIPEKNITKEVSLEDAAESIMKALCL